MHVNIGHEAVIAINLAVEHRCVKLSVWPDSQSMVTES